MTRDQARRLALALPDVTEQPHFEMWSFRLVGKIFATMRELTQASWQRKAPKRPAITSRRSKTHILRPFVGKDAVLGSCTGLF